MASYFGAGAGQSGSVQSLGGAIAGLDSGNNDKINPTYYSDRINNTADAYGKLFKPGELSKLAAQYGTAYHANDPLARDNANFYADQARGILGDNSRGIDTYERMRQGNISSLADVFKGVLDHGLAYQKSRLAAGGYGGSGPSSYDSILQSTMAAANLTPVLNTIYGGLGRDTSSLVGGDRAWDAYRMGQYATDPLTGYVDAATAGRVIQPWNVKRDMMGRDIGQMGQLLNQVIVPNVSGYQLDPGLGSKLNNVAAGVMNAAQFAGSMYGSAAGGGMGGMGGGGGGMGSLGGMMGGMGGGQGGAQPSGGGYNPYAFQQTAPMQYYSPYLGTGYGLDAPATISGGYPTTTAYA